ncbi:unnamed protein product [Mytilus coruscus]|uniref:Ig-like domain-containing protein n=1 Tax=Mytilus coruscus TaxID=42192 RepID=A0A6J8BW38_MYTCO|nr:unnamed protein product [Mytilus coruscus]
MNTVLRVTEALNFDLQCPGSGHWKYRSDAIGCSNSDTYYCLFNTINEECTENCTGPDFDQAGFRRVLRPVFDSEPCSSKRYQPFPFNTSGHNVCVYEKSFCSEEGQIANDTGTTTNDRTCRCDYTRGYEFIIRPKQTGGCVCSPSEEDCSCVLKKCEKDLILSADYKCIPKDLSPADTICPPFPVKEKNMTIILKSNLQDKALPFVLYGVERLKEYLKRALISSPLEVITCIEGQPAVFNCELRKPHMMVRWYKGSVLLKDTVDKITIESKDKMYVLTIPNTTKDSSGLYSIKINNESSKAQLHVRGVELAAEEVNYLRLVHLMLRIATPAVRAIFDIEFDPDQLKSGKTLPRYRIDQLVKHNHLTEKERDIVLFNTRKRDPSATDCDQSSKYFDLKLMITLIRNFTAIEIVDVLPKPSNIGTGADLSRLKYYRNQIVHNEGSFSNVHFSSYWNDICKAVVRLQNKAIHQDEKHIPKSMDENDPLVKAILASFANDTTEERNGITQFITKEESMYLRVVHLLHREACPAVRVKFDILFPPFELKQILQTKIQILLKQKGKKISRAQEEDGCVNIFNKTNGIPRSTNFSLQLMATCIWYASDREKITMEEWDVIKKLEQYIYRVAQNKGYLNKLEFDEYWNEISKMILFIGGENFNRSTIYLSLNTEHNTLLESTAS